MEFRLLGVVEADADGRALDTGSPQQRRVLAALAVDAGRPVTTETLIDRVWDEAVPGSRRTLQVHLTRIRRLLADAGGTDPHPARLVRRSGGYLLDIDRQRVDVHRFGQLLAQARAAALPTRERVALLREALSLWRGQPLSGLSGHWAARVREACRQDFLTAVVAWADGELEVGDPQAVVTRLTGLAGEYPLEESLVAALMRSLHLVGRSAEALTQYASLRRRLAEELGTDPGPTVQRVHQAILRGHPPTDLADEPRERSQPSDRLVPAMLPAALADFVGRDALIAELVRLLHTAGDTGRPVPVPVVALVGRGGIGKTALAVQVAQRLVQHFPDGQLYLDLRDGQSQSLTVGAALGRFLRALGVDGSVIPPDPAERAALYRTLLAGRRVLVVLDNAADAAQVSPLVPGGPGCAVLVTSRTRPAEVPGVQLVPVEVLEPDQAVALLGRIAGQSRVDAQHEAAERIVDLCGLLPLAVRIAGARLARRPHWRLDVLAERLRDEQRRLDELVTGDLDVRASLALSYQELEAPAARALRCLALLDAPDFAAWVVAPLLDIDVDRGAELIETLAEAHLIDAVDAVDAVDAGGQVRFRMHDLVRIYAQERAAAHDDEPGRQASVERALGAWLTLAEHADSRLPNRRLALVHSAAKRWTPPEPDALVPDPLAWFSAERASLIAAIEQACRRGWTDLAWDLAARCVDFFDLRDLHDDWYHTHRVVLAACRRHGDRRGEAVACRGLGDLATLTPIARTGDHLTTVIRARRIFHDSGDRSAEADALTVLASLQRAGGQGRRAQVLLDGASRLVDSGADPATATALFLERGFVAQELGQYELGRDFAQRCLELARAHGWRAQQADALQLLGSLYDSLGQPHDAVHHLEEALGIAVELDHESLQAWILCVLGGRYLSQHRLADAGAALDRAYALFRRLRLSTGQSAVLRWRGQLALAAGDPARALTDLAESLALSRRNRAPYLEAHVLKAIGSAHDAMGDRTAAEHHWVAARDVFAALGNLAEVGKTRELLARSGEPAP
ncbi:AfsR/SARP family transcriptional regulator [Rugosimonospora africana]|uniref:SARP family transcriptional regulator n=1 Tax=Rugosimonospora africana TaxID=556532 RepID=A0A8J3QS62_9ACTN|nr:BTAD domain-containing putative transcriptional regulator [Rugosimonospora africana]GIH14917.1 SARP family transcriptional regulator [Rugosimonospora africana]